jgi:PAS domain S-box-containing protein
MAEVTQPALIWTDDVGTITRWDQGAERLFGFRAEDAVGQSVRLIVPDSHVNEDDGLRARATRGETSTMDTFRRHQDGRLVRVSLTIAKPNADGAEGGSLLIIASKRATREEPDTASRRLAAIVESSDDAIISKDLNGIVMTWNRAAERIFGYSADEMIGRSIRTIIPDDRQAEEDATLATIARGDKLDHFQTIRRRKDGGLLPISLTVSPIRTEDGRIVGASKIARDMTAFKQAEAERFRLLEEAVAVTDTLNKVGGVVASDLDRTRVAQVVTDAGTGLTGARFGTFFYNVLSDAGESSLLYAASGVPQDAFSGVPMPRSMESFASIFEGAGVIRSPDVAKDPRYDDHSIQGMPFGYVSVRSFLAVPVKARSGEMAGALFFGHPDADRFSSRDEQLAVGIASWAAVALENARLYRSVQEANRLKDDFLATLSHELRTPLNAILGYARVLRTGIAGPEKFGRGLEAIERNANSLAQIVEDVLDVSRIISGKMRLDVQPVDLAPVVQTAIDAVRPAAEAKGVRIETVLDPRASPVSGDPDRLQQILWNLTSNAVKFTERGGRVQVRLERVNSHVEVTVSDTGVGISPEFLPHIFERFRQADGSTTRERGGLGLGLAIAKQLVEIHGGSIEASSTGSGQGATFRVKLPLMIVHFMQDEQPRVHPRSILRPPKTLLPDLAQVHVLAIDDDRDALALESEVLRAAGARVTTAYSALSALNELDTEKPDVLIVDLGMPQMDGFEFIARVRRHADPRVREIPAAALTAYARSEDRMRALRAGFQIHLAKPIDPIELTTTIASLARRFMTRVDDGPSEMSR